jgi:hypothetical protein
MIDGAGGGSLDPTVSCLEAVPEPPTIALLLVLGVIALFRVRWMRRTGRGLVVAPPDCGGHVPYGSSRAQALQDTKRALNLHFECVESR